MHTSLRKNTFFKFRLDWIFPQIRLYAYETWLHPLKYACSPKLLLVALGSRSGSTLTQRDMRGIHTEKNCRNVPGVQISIVDQLYESFLSHGTRK